ncbi:MAG: hypothetical protein M3247_06280 [Thermoproteota archaeon]|nr:hypothetical protein [Thermoproteota archaeon]
MNKSKNPLQMAKASVWLKADEMNEIDRSKGDISRSLFIRRAIRRALEDEKNQELQGVKVPARHQAVASKNEHGDVAFAAKG